MNDSNIPIVEPTIDYTKVPPIHQKRTVSFINHFVVNTVSFLNKFALSCEEKLYEFENKLQRVEASLVILESRLASIPGLDSASLEKPNCDPKTSETESNSKKDEPKAETTQETTIDIDEPDQKVDEPKIIQPESQPSDLIAISKHPAYEKYFRMVNVGVPRPAVKLKMTQDGLDPAILDEPQKQVPKPQTETQEEQ